MQLKISHSKCLVIGNQSKQEKIIERKKIWFIVRSKFRKATKKRYLGYAWLALDPLIISLIYLFVFTVVRANINTTSILIGITMYRVFQTSIQNGINAIPDSNGGIKCERISTKVLLSATVLHRLLDIILQTALITLVLIFVFGVSVLGGIQFILLCQLMGFLFFGTGSIISPIVKRIPDLGSLVEYALRLGFFASPAMYPMSKMSGVHYQINTYNPFSYFVETARLLFEVDTVIKDLNTLYFLSIIIILLIFTIIGFIRIDSLRWRMTTWS